MADFQTIGDAVQELLTEQRFLLNATTDPTVREQINARIEDLDEHLDDLIDTSWDQFKASNQYNDALAKLNAACDAVNAARKRLQDVDTALKTVDQVIGGLVQLLKFAGV